MSGVFRTVQNERKLVHNTLLSELVAFYKINSKPFSDTEMTFIAQETVFCHVKEKFTLQESVVRWSFTEN